MTEGSFRRAAQRRELGAAAAGSPVGIVGRRPDSVAQPKGRNGLDESIPV
jgi:hypothetical protein